jgi:predicted DNA-binding transcriptional regulator AlpA
VPRVRLRARGAASSPVTTGIARQFNIHLEYIVVTSTSETSSSHDRLLTVEDVARILGRSPQTIRKDISRRPAAVPPRLLIPGTRQLRWRAADVQKWLAKHAEEV